MVTKKAKIKAREQKSMGLEQVIESITTSDVIKTIKSKIIYPDKQLTVKKDSTDESVHIIKQYLEYDTADMVKTASSENQRIIFSCDIFIRKCCLYDMSSGQLLSAMSFRPLLCDGKINESVDASLKLVDEVWTYLVTVYGGNWSHKIIERLLDAVSRLNSVNLIEQYLDELEKRYLKRTEEAPLHKLLEFIEFDSDYFAEGEEKEYFEYAWSVFDLWYRKLCNINAILYAGKESQVQYAMDVVPILIGPQGTGKSTFVDKLVGGDLRFFERQSSLNIAFDKDELAKLASKLVCEVGEIGGNNFRDVNRIKDFLTKSVYEVRLAYGKSRVKIYRRWGGVGTSNSGSNLLNDETGNRRWFPIYIKKINVENLASSDVCAEILAWYWNKAKKRVLTLPTSEFISELHYENKTIIDNPQFKQRALEQQESAQYTPDYFDAARIWLKNHTQYKLRKDDIYFALFPKNDNDKPFQRGHRPFQNYIGKLLIEMGFSHKAMRLNGKITRCWIHFSADLDKSEWYCDSEEARGGIF